MEEPPRPTLGSRVPLLRTLGERLRREPTPATPRSAPNPFAAYLPPRSARPTQSVPPAVAVNPRSARQQHVVSPWVRRPDAFARVLEVARAADPVMRATPWRTPSAEEVRTIERSIAIGADLIGRRAGPDEDGYVIGLDFGTSSTKVVVRQPYTAGDPCRALTAPACLGSGDAHLWPSMLWLADDGRFSLLPVTNGQPLAGFKAGLIADQADAPAGRDAPCSRREAAAAFVAAMLAHIAGRCELARPLGDASARAPLAYNISVPISTMEDRAALARFGRVVHAAHVLAPFAENLTLGLVREGLEAADDALPDGYNLVPELVGCIAGYAQQPDAPLGPHMLVDVGAATLDIVVFNLVQHEGARRAAVFGANVALLGADALTWAAAAGVGEPMFKDACDHHWDQSYRAARDDALGGLAFAPGGRRVAAPLLLTGGGLASPLHLRFCEEATKSGVLACGAAKRPRPPAHVADPKADPSRLLLAYGLARDPDAELVDMKAPSQIDRVVRHRHKVETVTKDVC